MFKFDQTKSDEILKYAKLCANRGYVSNTLGNLCLKASFTTNLKEPIYYTKHQGVSLEEINTSHIVVMGLESGSQYHGNIKPSLGDRLNREILKHREDVSAVIHLHIDEVIAFFSATRFTHLPIISVDTPLVLEAPVRVLEPGINIEISVELVKDIISETNVIIMPDHGITTTGATLSQAYHRLNSVVAEIKRYTLCTLFTSKMNTKTPLKSNAEIDIMYEEGSTIIYDDRNPIIYTSTSL